MDIKTQSHFSQLDRKFKNKTKLLKNKEEVEKNNGQTSVARTNNLQKKKQKKYLQTDPPKEIYKTLNKTPEYSHAKMMMNLCWKTPMINQKADSQQLPK